MTYSATVYRVLVASPSDVAEERGVIPQVISEWNAVHSASLGVVLLPVGWKTHSSPEMGGRPQAIINQQIVRDSDILVGVFWTRLGTPTGQAESGTAEEIEEFKRAGKPVMLYFSSVPVVLDSVNPDEYERLRAFKERCRHDGLVWDYGTTEELRRELYRHLLQQVHRLRGNEGEGPRQTTGAPQTVAVRPASRFADLDTYLRTLEAELKAELASGPIGLDDAKAITAMAERRLLDLMGNPEVAASTSTTTTAQATLADFKRVQHHQLYIDGGRSFRQFWEAVDSIVTRFKKVAALVHVRAYLESAFPGWVLTDGEQVARDSYWFSVRDAQTGETHRALVSNEFLDDVPSDRIEEALHEWQVANEMRQAGEDFVLVSTSGARERIRKDDI